MEDYNKIVLELNIELFEKFGEEEINFGYTTNGFYDIITFGNNQLWNSENDERIFDEETGEYESFEPFIKKIFNEWADKINSLKF